ncbi:UNVERIFIED_CONTAM: hypothetical protein FKN15_005058 [Acipenser sinensis]
MGLSPRPRSRTKRFYCSGLQKTKLSLLPKTQAKEGENSLKKLCILTAIKPSNVEKEKAKFFKSEFTYNPQFEYANPASPPVLARHNSASDRFLRQAVRIMELALQKYGNYEKFEQATGGSLLTKSRIWYHVKKYMEKEGCMGEIVVHLTDDLLSRASMTVVNGRPTLTINISSAREHWLEGMLRHEIGTHYFRGINNNLQPWCNGNGRIKYSLKPTNPTEEGLASIHSVLFRKDPFLWRAALLYYTVYQASRMSFTDLFHCLGKFVKDPSTRWDYCVRAKRGQTNTSLPGCFGKDQVYLDGILKILRYREKINFSLLTALGKVSYEDVDRLKEIAMMENVRIPYFLQDQCRYMEQLNKIMEVNQITDAELQAKDPSCPNRQCRITEAHLKKGYAAATEAVRLSNVASLLTVYQAALLRDLPECPSAALRTELGTVAQLLVKLAQLNARAQGRSIASLVVARRQLWLSQARVQEPDKVPLLDAPISPGHTFGPAVEEMLQRSVKAREASQQLAKMWPSKPFQPRRPQERQWRRAPPQQQAQSRGSMTAPSGVSARGQPAFVRPQRGGWRPRGGGRPRPRGSGQAPRERAQPKQP